MVFVNIAVPAIQGVLIPEKGEKVIKVYGRPAPVIMSGAISAAEKKRGTNGSPPPTGGWGYRRPRPLPEMERNIYSFPLRAACRAAYTRQSRTVSSTTSALLTPAKVRNLSYLAENVKPRVEQFLLP